MAFASLWTRPTQPARGRPVRIPQRRSILSGSKGFTVIELLVVCAIIVVITALVLIDNNKFGGDVQLENFAYDVALSVRQAQVYGIAVERFGTSCSGSTDCFGSGYGMHFALSSPTQYLLFNDENNTGVYSASVLPSEIVGTPDRITQGFYISGLCVVSGISQTCQSTNQIDIMYIRPEPTAYISAGGVQCYNTQQNCYYEAQVTLKSPKGDTRTVVVDSTGQISVQLQ
ncbi:MAG: prepilin-type N-terminal cleavage/methylation domain-containing protein [Candidatus Pacebacteria bacterium]|nr:prepilin-type N-terminal cleavage/methylation domain-containing protein [Candidatus Paceibacterota bacterium]